MGRKFWIAVIVLFVAFSIMDWIFHSLVMGKTYEATSHLWRSIEEMNRLRPVMWLVTLVMSFFFVLIFGKGYEGKGAMEGVRFGIYMGIFFGFPMGFGSYSAMPITGGVAFGWFFITLIEFLVAGVLVASIYKPEKAAPAV
ncbi:MAG: hypothetical protein FJY73_08180 [Candidatus Eisenbacteria bacterium]|nr:hypothetical protein [Candidatus Eisenbacteria bacterium]